ncbi:MAG: acyl carrier protein [Hyphomicrobiaceae bacterium]|nr:MAG: acyl carrier protein [Hyphomicrobiaceae bacterium]
MKISAAIARLAMEGRTPSEVSLVDRITTFVAREPHAFLGSGAFLALGRRLKEAGVQPVEGEQVDIAAFAGAITVAEVRQLLVQEQPAAADKPPMEYPQVLAQVRRVVASACNRPIEHVAPDTKLGLGGMLDAAIGFDSLALVELTLALEEHFEVEIPEGYPGLDAVKTVEDLARICEKVLLDTGKVADHDAPTGNIKDVVEVVTTFEIPAGDPYDVIEAHCGEWLLAMREKQSRAAAERYRLEVEHWGKEIAALNELADFHREQMNKSADDQYRELWAFLVAETVRPDTARQVASLLIRNFRLIPRKPS